MMTKVLIVDDDVLIREEVVEFLENEGFICVEAENGADGLDLLCRDFEISIVISDLVMPVYSGLDMVNDAQSAIGKAQDLEFIIVTGQGREKEAIAALNLGVMDFLHKPIDLEHLAHVVRRAEELVFLKRESREYKIALEEDVQLKTMEIRKLLDNVQHAYTEALECLAMAAEFKDPETGNHISRIGEYAQLIAKELGWSEECQRLIRFAAPLHDLGKIGTPESILLKPSKLDFDEVAIMKEHSQNGYDILSQSKQPVMQLAASIARNHHECWDGSGYPRGLKSREIPVEARIAAIVDVYDALRSKRPYKEAFDHEKTLSIMLHGDGRTKPSHFDPELLVIFQKVHSQFDEIYLKRID